MTNDEWLIFVISNFHFTTSRYSNDFLGDEYIDFFKQEIKEAILQCSAAELMIVANFICRDGRADPFAWYIRLHNFARSLFNGMKIQ
ncbi:MAG: hypothetical protein BWY51_00954 [Parcubacteria group bacterium ADurb.Bin316]|nr:MAG: hypothetical protein BWY51_00954 [Parcubacteria group bacterium ADurb.Bin316]HOZ56386.1 hypothetical protein [bacterium]